jgi:hypothetical protein
MALVLNDRVKQTSTTTGTGAMTFASAVTGFETFAQGIGNSNTTYYGIFNGGTAEFEVGLGTLNGDSTTLTRTTVISSSNSDSAVNFTSGTKDVFCTLPASKAVFEDASNNVSLQADLTVGALLKMPDVTSGKVLIADGTSYQESAMSGDATIASGGALTLANSGVTAASYTNSSITVDAKGRVTSASSGSAGASAGFAVAMAIAL